MILGILRIERKKQWVNKALAIEIYIDGEKAGTIADGEVKDFQIYKEQVKVYAKLDWCKTIPITIKIYRGIVSQLEVGCNIKRRSASLSTSLSSLFYIFYGAYWAFFKSSEYLYIRELYENDITKWKD